VLPYTAAKGSGEDLKVYVVGEEVFAVRKEFSAMSFIQAGRPSQVSPEVHDIALRCGQVFGLGLYGLDII
jgi:ribosomal protein S6--L-glutamate ligase